MCERRHAGWIHFAHARDQHMDLAVEQRQHLALEAMVAQRHAKQVREVDRLLADARQVRPNGRSMVVIHMRHPGGSLRSSPGTLWAPTAKAG